MPYSKHFPFVFFLGLMLAGVAASGGCGSSSSGSDSSFNLGGSSSGASGGGASSGGINTFGDSGVGAFGMRSTCANSASSSWACKVDQSCSSSSPTSLTGKVYDPAGLNPLYDIIVFIPNDPSSLPAIQPGTHTCNTCDVSIGNYVAATTTDATGSFTLKGVPTGSNVPVTVQIGKWRRTITMNIPNTCTANAAADKSLRLPGKRSEGDMPQMAVLTGGCDDFGCFLSGMGIDPSEFSAPHGGGRLDVYQGVGMGGGGFLGGGGGGGAATLSSGTAGNCTNASCPLWSSKSALEAYDIVMLSCECAENRQTKPAAGQQALHDWLGEGGKVFASHYHYTWFRDSPTTDFQGVASWGNAGMNDYAMTTMKNYDIDTSFPKGATFGTWLSNVGALKTAGPPPQVALSPVADSVVSVNSPTVRWIYDPSTTHVKYLSFQTPIGGMSTGMGETPTYCGKAVYTDLHTAGEVQSTVASIPNGCPAGPLSAQQKALEFLFFDLSACVSNDSAPPPMVPPTM